jgi:hypothetical protein
MEGTRAVQISVLHQLAHRYTITTCRKLWTGKTSLPRMILRDGIFVLVLSVLASKLSHSSELCLCHWLVVQL